MILLYNNTLYVLRVLMYFQFTMSVQNNLVYHYCFRVSDFTFDHRCRRKHLMVWSIALTSFLF